MKVMVFDVGGTEIKYSVMDEQLNRADAGSVPTPGDTQEHFLATLEALYRPHAAEVDGIAMSLPGFIDAEHGVVRGGGAPSLLYNIGTPVGPRLAQRCGCRVFLENDGKAAAIAELQLGALKGCTNGAVFIIGTGVGGGIIRDMMVIQVPAVLRKHVYACASIAGAVCYVLLYDAITAGPAMILSTLLVIAIRLLARHYEWNLPKAI